MKQFITYLTLTLSLLTLSSNQVLRSQTPSTNQDSTFCLSPYQTQLVNLDHAAMLYWSKTSTSLNQLYKLEQKKTEELNKVILLKNEALSSLQDAYNNKCYQYDMKEQELKFANKQITILKLKNTILSIGVAGLTLSTIYFAAF